MKFLLSILFAGVLACSSFGQGVGPAGGGSGTTINSVTVPADARTLREQHWKGITLTNGVPFPFFTISGQACTITEINVDPPSIAPNFYPSPMFQMSNDSLLNPAVQYYSFTASHGVPYTYHSASFNHINTRYQSTTGCDRVLPPGGINIKSNCTLWFTPTVSGVFFSQVFYKVGVPPSGTSTTHMLEVSNTLAPGAIQNGMTVTNAVGQMTLTVQYLLSTNILTFLEYGPAYVLDGNPLIAYGGEDFYGTAYYGNGGFDSYMAPTFGFMGQSWLQCSMAPFQITGYRYFSEGANFTNGCYTYYTNCIPTNATIANYGFLNATTFYMWNTYP